MKLIYTILFLICFKANATIYYVSNAGNDSNNGTSTSTTWQTIAKVNSVTLNPGDQVLFKAGDSWNERLNPANSGSAGSVITFGSYGTGAKPIFTGFQTLAGGTNVGNVWSFTFSNSVHYQNTVLVNGTLAAKGRYPNYGFLTYTATSGNNQITGSLTGTPNYTGGEVVLRANRWSLVKGFITSQSTGTINYSPTSYYSPTANWGYIIENTPSVLDTLNEWCYDTTTKVIKVYATSSPTVKASSIDTLINLYKKNYITIDGIAFEGANKTSIQADSCNHITITNCDMINSGRNGITGIYCLFMNISHCTINNSWNDGILFSSPFGIRADNDDANIHHNVITNTGTTAGMMDGEFSTNTGIQFMGDRDTISNNSITNSGYLGIWFYGDTCLVKNNLIDTFLFVKDDGGGIYTVNANSPFKKGSRITGNIVIHGLDAIVGTQYAWNENYLSSFGIYTDDGTEYVTIDSNTVWNGGVSNIFLHDADHITISNNTLLSNNYFNLLPSVTSTSDLRYKGNIAVSTTSHVSLQLQTSAWFSQMDSNYYANTTDTNRIIQASNLDYFSPYFGLKRWQDSTGFDTHSHRLPSGITSANPILKYNASESAVTHGLAGTYIDMKGTVYNNAVTVQPNQSVLLFKATTDIITPSNGLRYGGRYQIHKL